MKSILLVAGDPSGDMRGAELIRALKDIEPSLTTTAVGGPLMRNESEDFLENLALLGIAGFWEPVRRLPFFWNLRGRLKDYLSSRRPDAVVCIDYYGFNRWVLAAAREAAVPAYYYVSPQVWASRPGRIRTLRRLVRRMFVIFPFEEAIYRDAGVPVSYVGHPLLDQLPEPVHKDESVNSMTIGLLPGSREAEVSRHLPIFLSALDILRRDFPSLEAQVFAASTLPDSVYFDALRRGVRIVRETDYAMRSKLDLALSSSGTATLENALLGVPMIVVYRMSWPTYWIARSLIRVPYISMANLLAGRALSPELIQDAATPESVASAAANLLSNPEQLSHVRKELLFLRDLLGSPGAASRTAKAILKDLEPAKETVAAQRGLHS